MEALPSLPNSGDQKSSGLERRLGELQAWQARSHSKVRLGDGGVRKDTRWRADGRLREDDETWRGCTSVESRLHQALLCDVLWPSPLCETAIKPLLSPPAWNDWHVVTDACSPSTQMHDSGFNHHLQEHPACTLAPTSECLRKSRYFPRLGENVTVI